MAEHPVGATATTFRVVDALRASQPAGVTELADRLDLSKSAVHNHLATLEALDLAVNDDGTYRLGLRFLDYGTSVRDELPLVGTGRGAVDSLAAQSGATASLVVPEFGHAVYAYAPPNPNAVGPSDGVRTGTARSGVMSVHRTNRAWRLSIVENIPKPPPSHGVWSFASTR